MAHPSELPTEELIKSCQFSRHRRSGPGGQHRNKVETAVRVLHLPSGVFAEASERRSQAENRQVALFRLRVNLALQWRSDRCAYPSELWKGRCHKGVLSVNPSHLDFPALLSEALDVLNIENYDVRSAAGQLDCSPTQLIRLLKMDMRALKLVNDHRLEKGWSIYR